MHRIAPLFRRRTDMILNGQVDLVINDYQTPLWIKLQGQLYLIENRDMMWQALSRQHLSQKARGVQSVDGEMEDVVRLAHGALRVTMHWRETTDPKAADAARWYRTVHVCRPVDEGLRITGLTVTETRPVPVEARPKGFPPPCEDW